MSNKPQQADLTWRKAIKVLATPMRIIIIMAFLTIGAWGIGHMPVALLNLLPAWFLIWVKGLGIILSIIVVSFVLLLALAYCSKIWHKENKHDNFHGSF